MYWSHLLSQPAYIALVFVLSTVFGPWSVLPLLPFLLRFPNGDVSGWRRRIDPFVWVFLALAYVLYVVEWRAYYGIGIDFPHGTSFPAPSIPLAPLSSPD